MEIPEEFRYPSVLRWDFPATGQGGGWRFWFDLYVDETVPFGSYVITVTVGADNDSNLTDNVITTTVVVTEARLESGVVIPSWGGFVGKPMTVTGVVTNVGLLPTEFGGGFLLIDTNGDLLFYEEIPMTSLNPGEVFEIQKVFTPTVVGTHRLHLLVSQPYGPPPPDVVVDFQVHEWPDALGLELAVVPNPVKVNKQATIVVTNTSSIPLDITVYIGHEEWWELGWVGPGLSLSHMFTPTTLITSATNLPVTAIGEWEGPRVSASAELTVEAWLQCLPVTYKGWPPQPKLVIKQPDITVWLTRRGTEERYLDFWNAGSAPLVGSAVAITKPEDGAWLGGATYFEVGLQPGGWNYVWLKFKAGNAPGYGEYYGVLRFTTNDPRGVIEIPVTLHVMRQEDIPTPTRSFPTATPVEPEPEPSWTPPPIQTAAPTPRSVQAVKITGPLSALALASFATPTPTPTPTATPTATPTPYIPGW
ncbi:MAG TPA: hypothetical protein VMW41_06905 [Candidatus Bathyarchaeia archaeon]|nr:hypothetical protein [Candidatus Bathyarchaeia archaeon]